MGSSETGDLAAILAMLPELYAPVNFDPWPERATRAVSRLVGDARVSYNLVELPSGMTHFFQTKDRASGAEVLLSRLVNADPAIRDIRNRLTPEPVRLTDFLNDAQITRSELYNVYYRPVRVKHQMAFALHRSPARIIFISATRQDDFSERERSTLGALVPHLVHAMTHLVKPIDWGNCGPIAPGSLTAGGTATDPHPAALAPLRDLNLTPRQAEVLYWITQGKRDGEIAIILDASVRTINHHVETILRRLNVETRQTAALRAVTVIGLDIIGTIHT